MDKMTLVRLSTADTARLKNSARIAQQLEDLWAAKIERTLMDQIPETITSLERTGKPFCKDLTELFVEHFFQVSIQAMKFAMTESEPDAKIPKGKGKKLATKYPKVEIPRALADLMRLYDLWKRKRFIPKQQFKQAKEIKKAYLDKCKSVWEKHAEEFRSGGISSQENVTKKIREAARTTTSRAKTIVRTETTNYYNTARKQFYDMSPDITHYLFIAVRDAGTSPWCTPLTIDGKRGRSGLVYAKSDPLCEKEKPACHPNCRSEYLPLNNLNPTHLKFINDPKIQRRAHTCFPLLRGWK